MRKCSLDKCHNKHYARNLCRKHYRQARGESGWYKKEYDKRKNNPEYKKMKRESDKKYREKLKKQGVLKEKQQEYYQRWISKKQNKLKKLTYNNKWKTENQDRVKRYDKKAKDNRHFNGKREQIMERDGYKCAECGMSRDDSFEKWGFDLDIHHIDGNGRGTKDKNNKIDNLVVLCRSCHKKIEPTGIVAVRMIQNDRVNP